MNVRARARRIAAFAGHTANFNQNWEIEETYFSSRHPSPSPPLLSSARGRAAASRSCQARSRRADDNTTADLPARGISKRAYNNAALSKAALYCAANVQVSPVDLTPDSRNDLRLTQQRKRRTA